MTNFQATGRLGPETTVAEENAMIEIHPDNSAQVRQVYAEYPRLRFQSFEPEIQESHNPRYGETPVMGRSENYLSYEGTDNRKVSLELTYASSMETIGTVAPGDVRGEYPMAAKAARWLQSLNYPTYEQQRSGIMYPPALLSLFLGRWLNMRCVMTQCNVTWGPAYGGGAGETQIDWPIVCKISTEFTAVNTEPMQASDFVPRTRSALSLPGIDGSSRAGFRSVR